MEGILFNIGFTSALLFPLIVIAAAVIGVYVLLITLLYEKHKAMVVGIIALSLVGLAAYAVMAWNQYEREGFICWGENLCLTGEQQYPSGSECFGDCGRNGKAGS